MTLGRYHQLLELLTQRVSEIHARSALDRAVAYAGSMGTQIDESILPVVIRRIERHIALFLPDEERETLRRQLHALIEDNNRDNDVESVLIEILGEHDIVAARGAARQLAIRLGASRVVAQKAATIVSELSRNIVSYTPGGTIQLVPDTEARRLAIRATDGGRGIPNLDEIFSGQYKSRTGLGLGILGSKRLSDAFQVETGPDGTSIQADVSL